MAKLTTIEGVADTLAAKLKKSGVGSVESLLKKGRTPAGRKDIAEKSGIDSKRILRFVNHADLMRIKSVVNILSCSRPVALIRLKSLRNGMLKTSMPKWLKSTQRRNWCASFQQLLLLLPGAKRLNHCRVLLSTSEPCPTIFEPLFPICFGKRGSFLERC